MAFLDSLEAIRKRPEKERRRLALLWTVSIMVFVVVFWLATFKMVRLPGQASEKKPGVLGQALSGFVSEVKKGASVIGEQVKVLEKTGVVETK